MLYDYGKLDFLGLMPCPLRVAFEKKAWKRREIFERETGQRINGATVSAMNARLWEDLLRIERMEDWPAVVMAPGFGIPYTKAFMERFRDGGCFESILERENPLFDRAGLYDPRGLYDIIGVSATVFLVDKTTNPHLRTPEGWMDLGSAHYERKVGFRGHEWRGFCETALLSAFIVGGYALIRDFARSARCCLYPSELARLSTSRREIAPNVSVLAYPMAMAGLKTENTRIVWPKEGAGPGVLTLLTKKDAPERARAFARSLVRNEYAAFGMGGFYSTCDTKPYGEGDLLRFDWDLAERGGIPLLLNELNRLMAENADIIRTRPFQNPAQKLAFQRNAAVRAGFAPERSVT
ncbi:MAG: ABC transporter substrate-binding protein [Clostridiales Family XIII bacterium]|nr:ABC transporter substrate-binding protein [Clostridiales Family XIII bacterium]